MISITKKKYLIPAAAFVGLPLLFWALGDFPRRTVLKEFISILTILAFFTLLGQLFLSRGNKGLLENFRFGQVVKIHKYFGYAAVIIILLHPFLIVLPRFFESGVDPTEAFLTLITTFSSLGVLLGLISWVLLLTLGLTSLLRNKLGMSYGTWRMFHGILSMAFIILATWHVIDLGRHSDWAMSIYMVIVAACGLVLVLKSYMFNQTKKMAEK